MIFLALGVAAFAVLHLVPAVPAVKATLQAQLGGRNYGMMFGIGSILTLALIILGWRMANFVPVYEPPVWGWHVTFLLVAVAFLLLAVFIFRGRLRQTLRFPLAFAVIAWATGHLFANGDLASLILFGGLLTYAGLHLTLGFANNVRPSPETRQGHDALALFIGLALYGLMTQVHPYVIGVPVLTLVQ
jgi:uncharacterized membrane protein